MQGRSVGISAGFHLAVIIIATVSLPWLKKDYVIPQPIAVEFLDISKVTETVKVAPPVPKPEKKEEPKPVAPPPPATPKNTSAEPVTPVKPDKTEDKPDKKEDTVLVDPNAAPDKKKTKKEEKKKEVTKEEPKKDFMSVLKNLEDKKDAPPVKSDTPDMKADEAPQEEAQQAPIGAKMTMSEEDALRQQLAKCWNPPLGAKDAENLRVEIFMVINPDRTLRSARVVDTSRYNSDPFFRAAADSAMRAVQLPLCSPFQVPPDKYDTWKETTVTFDPSQMF